MSLIPESEIREVYEITDKEKQRIIDFLQGAVYCWCKNRPNKWFSIKRFNGWRELLLGRDTFICPLFKT